MSESERLYMLFLYLEGGNDDLKYEGLDLGEFSLLTFEREKRSGKMLRK